MTFEEWWKTYQQISIYGKGYKALAKDAWEASQEKSSQPIRCTCSEMWDGDGHQSSCQLFPGW